MSQEKLDKYWINNYRMGGYMLFACGLINLRYQWGEPDIISRSLLIVGPGAAIIGATFVPALVSILAPRSKGVNCSGWSCFSRLCFQQLELLF